MPQKTAGIGVKLTTVSNRIADEIGPAEDWNVVRIRGEFIYSGSGKPYPRRPARGMYEINDLRLPYLKNTLVKGQRYWYFMGPVSVDMAVRLPSPNEPDFQNAYLNALAQLEGEQGASFRYAKPAQHVYFFGAGEFAIKIGMATDVQRRLKGCQTGSPIPLTLLGVTVGGRKEERAYHERFSKHRLHGEWFAHHPDILAEIERLSVFPLLTGEGV